MKPTKLDGATLLRRCASAPSPTLLEELKQRAGEILALIENEDIEFTTEELQGFDENATGLAAVVALLAEADCADRDLPAEKARPDD